MSTCKNHRFTPDIISYAVWLSYRFNLSYRNIEHLLAERSIIVTRELIQLWCINFGALYARRLKRKHRGFGDTFYIDEIFVKINGKQHYLWRAVDKDGVAHRELISESIHITDQYANNRAEQSHELTRVRERGMRRFKSIGQAPRFVTVHAAV